MSFQNGICKVGKILTISTNLSCRKQK